MTRRHISRDTHSTVHTTCGTCSTMNTFTCFFAFCLTLTALSAETQPGCGYQSCPKVKPGMLNVHIIAHTHDDVGWLKTYDQYFYGSHSYITHAGVQYILDSVIQELQLNPDRRFIYVESAFFMRWWESVDDTIKSQVHKLVDSGQLEFIGGGWTMNDEAAAFYNDIIDQMTLGLRELKNTFGECGVPRVAWQIDPFGHSREQALLFAQMGFDGLFVGRIDYQDKDQRLKLKQMEFVWNASSSLDKDSHLFTGVLYNGYSAPPNFCFDMIMCSDDPIIDDKRLPDYNVDSKVSSFLTYVTKQATVYHTSNIAVTMGNDFNYQQAGVWFKNLDKLIKYTNDMQLNNGSNVNLLYSTPSCYLKSLYDSNTTWSTKTDDFFPYASDPHSYWTGYFTSRPALKGYIRKTNNFLQVCKHMAGFIANRPSPFGDVEHLNTAHGVTQHHDAVSGTSKQAVQDDYVRLLSDGVDRCQEVIADAYGKLMSKRSGEQPPEQRFCPKLNVSQCDVTEKNGQFVVTIYNPLAHAVNHPVRIPVTGKSYNVMDPNLLSVDSQLVPIPTAVKSLPDRNSTASAELVFLAHLPAMGFASYFVTNSNFMLTSRNQRSSVTTKQYLRDDIVISSDYVKVIIDGNTGLMKEVINLDSKISLNVSQNFHWYQGAVSPRASGAYVFCPNGTDATPMSETASTTIIQGNVVNEVHQTFNEWVTQIIRLYKNSRHVEMEWLVGPIPIKDNLGKEIITRFVTPLDTKGVYFTDANGRQTLRRVRNKRPTWHLNVTQPVSGNYYPINNRVYIQGTKQEAQLTLLTDRSVGGGSIADGSLEIMIHRRLLHDDGFGVGEALNEPGFDRKGLRVRGTTMLLVNHPKDAAVAHRELAMKMAFAPVVSFAATQLTPTQWRSKFLTTFNGINEALPANVHLLTYENIAPDSFLIRLEHFYEKFEAPGNLSLHVTVNLKGMFATFSLLDYTCEEMMLAADRLKTGQTFNWETKDNQIHRSHEQKKTENNAECSAITLIPMQIRTFVIQVRYPPLK